MNARLEVANDIAGRCPARAPRSLRKMLRTVVTAIAAVNLVAACSSGGSGTAPSGDAAAPEGSTPHSGGAAGIGETGGDTGAGGAPDVVHTYAPTFTAIHTEIVLPTCASAFCHLSDDLGFDASTKDRTYETLVGAKS